MAETKALLAALSGAPPFSSQDYFMEHPLPLDLFVPAPKGSPASEAKPEKHEGFWSRLFGFLKK